MSNENIDDDDMNIGPSFENISLSSFGVFPMFSDIDEVLSQRCVEFILKANIILKPNFPLTFFINSPGGSVTAGWAITTMMETSNNPISTVALGEIASMGLMVFVAGSRGMRIMTPNTLVMSHQWSAGVFGKQHELVAARKLHDQLEHQFIRHLKYHTKMSEKLIRDTILGPSDAYLTAEECLKYGICDEIKDPFIRADNDLPASLKKKVRKPRAPKVPSNNVVLAA
jgi:ATP-dependent Clp endopeptidase proteolytic subunit ClpP